MAEQTDSNGNVITFELDTKNTYVGETMAFNINVTTAGLDTTDATATSKDIITNKTAYINGAKVIGTLETQEYYTGTSVPDDSLGNNGDIYFKIASS